MTLKELDDYFNAFLHKENYTADSSRNGLQIQNSAPSKKQITKVAFAVDACEATVKAAAKAGAQLLFVHHGLFWNDVETLTGSFYKRIKPFLENDMALYASHIPLDANNPYGNNYGLASRIKLEELQPFGEWRGMCIGVKGVLPKPLAIDKLQKAVMIKGQKPLRVLPFGKTTIKTVGIISGGAGGDVYQAIRDGLDAYITGEVNHDLYHYIEESGMNMIAMGHYQSETVGVSLVREKLETEKHLQTIFIDIPTGL